MALASSLDKSLAREIMISRPVSQSSASLNNRERYTLNRNPSVFISIIDHHSRECYFKTTRLATEPGLIRRRVSPYCNAALVRNKRIV